MKKNIFISTGEVSGDIHGSYLIKELLKLDPELNITAFGSVEIKQTGVNVLGDIAPYSGVGLVENIPSVKPIKHFYDIAKDFFIKNKPDLVILIDNQGFNFRLADLTQKLKIPTVYYIGPQEWIWGFKKGPKKVINRVNKLFAIFKKEYELYQKLTDKVIYVGHPLLDIINKVDKNEVKHKLDIKSKFKVLGLMPGSRKHEINKLLPEFIKTAELLIKEDNIIKPIIITSVIWENYIIKNFDCKNIPVYSGNSTYNMQGCDLLLVASGTVTLEAALLKIPVIANYKLSKLSYFIARLLIKLEYFTLPNIISDEQIINEFIQEEVNPNNLFKKSYELINNIQKREELIKKYDIIEEILKPKGAIETTAKEIIKLL